MTSLKAKTITGLMWSFLDNFSKLGITFIIGIILARLLTPKEFGLIGMITIFIAISQSLVDSGFTQALIRKKDCTQEDYSTVFYFNIIIGILIYIVLFLSSSTIGLFFNEQQLKLIVKIISLGIIFNAFTVVHRAKLIKEINFKLQTKISIIASIISGIVGIALAYKGFGVWSLVFKMLLNTIISSFLLFLWNKWIPSNVFSMSSFREMFSFGYKLLLSGMIDTIYKNIYLLIIGKYFSAIELGYYTRAQQFSELPSSNITGVIQRVSYPVLSEIQGNIPRLKLAYQKLIKSTMFITFISMMILVAIAKPLILVLIGEKWLPSVIYLQLLCFVGMLYPLHAININMLNVQGRSNLVLKIAIYKKTLIVPFILLGIVYGIEVLIIGMIVHSIISFFINSYYSGKYINYSSFQQLKDIYPSFILSLFVAILTYFIGFLLNLHQTFVLFIQIIIGLGTAYLLMVFFKMKDFLFLKEIVTDKIKGSFN